MLLVVMAALASVPLAAQRSDTTDTVRPIEALLNPDGTLKLDEGFSGALDPTGWQMTVGSSGEPRFVPSLAASDTLIEGNQYWSDKFGPPGTNGPVYAIVVNDGKVYVGGSFTTAGNAIASNLAVWNGSRWSELAQGVGGPVLSLAIAGDELFVGGQFLSAGNASARSVASCNLQTGVWSALGSGVWAGFTLRKTLPNARVNAIAVDGDNVYIAGFFNEAGPARCYGVAVWNRALARWTSMSRPDTAAIYDILLHDDTVYAVGGALRNARGGVYKWNGTGWSTVAGGVDDTVYAAASYQGSLYIGGRFTSVGPDGASEPVRYVARLDESTDRWVPVGSGVDAMVRSLDVVDGDLYAGGAFTSAGAKAAGSIARWNGAAWESLQSGMGDSIQPVVHGVALAPDGIIAIGSFVTAGTVTAHNVAVFDQSRWWPVGSRHVVDFNTNGVDGSVYALALSGSNLYVGGDFHNAGGKPAAGVARWDGAEWRPLGDGVGGAASFVRTMVVGQDGSLYVGGIFTEAGGSPASGIARWDGTAWSSVAGGVGGPNPYVFALARDGATLYAAGAFTVAGGDSARRIAAFNTTTGTWSPLGTGLRDTADVYSYVTALAIFDGDLYAGGVFTRAGDSLSPNIARWDGTDWSPVGHGIGASVSALAADATDLYVGGDFIAIDTLSARRIARFDGQRWHAMGAGLDGRVYAITVSDSGVTVGGDFTMAGGAPAQRIARFDGSAWHPLSGGTNGQVNAIATDGRMLYAGGHFSIAGGRQANNVAAWDVDGWSSLGSDPTSGLYGPVLAIALDGSDVYVGGIFNTAGGVKTNGIARWDGTAWQPLGRGVDGIVRAIVVDGDYVYVGGEIRRAGDIATGGIARWNRRTESWEDVGGGVSGNSPYVFDMVLRGSDLYVGGSFTGAGAVSANRVARWNTATETWSSLGDGIIGSGYYTYVSALAMDPDGNLYVGGIFPSAGHERANNIARWDGSEWYPMGEGLDNAVYGLAVAHGHVYATGMFRGSGFLDADFIAYWDGQAWNAMGDGLDRPGLRYGVV